MFDRVLSCFRLYALFGFFALGFCGAQLNAENRNHQFKVYVNGLKVGEFVYAETFTSNAYATRGIIRSTGLAAVITQYKFDGEAHGRRSGNTFRPTRYREQSDTGNRSSNKEMIYKNGVPKLTSSGASMIDELRLTLIVVNLVEHGVGVLDELQLVSLHIPDVETTGLTTVIPEHLIRVTQVVDVTR